MRERGAQNSCRGAQSQVGLEACALACMIHTGGTRIAPSWACLYRSLGMRHSPHKLNDITVARVCSTILWTGSCSAEPIALNAGMAHHILREHSTHACEVVDARRQAAKVATPHMHV